MNRRTFVPSTRSAFAPAGTASSVDAAATRRRARFANPLLRTHEGATARFYDDLLKNKTVLVNFMYTHCAEQCPITIARLAEVQRLLGGRAGRDVFIYSISVDPQRDTPAVLRDYSRMAGATGGWLFLTGEMDDIRRIRANFGDSPDIAFDRSNHLNLIAYGIEALERWGGFPAWTTADNMVRYLDWIRPAGARPSAPANLDAAPRSGLV
jgi:protein SCO1